MSFTREVYGHNSERLLNFNLHEPTLFFQAEAEVYDVPYFRRKLNEETERLEMKCKFWSDKVNDTLSQDVQDQVAVLSRPGVVQICFKCYQVMHTCLDVQQTPAEVDKWPLPF